MVRDQEELIQEITARFRRVIKVGGRPCLPPFLAPTCHCPSARAHIMAYIYFGGLSPPQNQKSGGHYEWHQQDSLN
jgi:hypothetical protein